MEKEFFRQFELSWEGSRLIVTGNTAKTRGLMRSATGTGAPYEINTGNRQDAIAQAKELIEGWLAEDAV